MVTKESKWVRDKQTDQDWRMTIIIDTTLDTSYFFFDERFSTQGHRATGPVP